jgi:hypothetical protein
MIIDFFKVLVSIIYSKNQENIRLKKCMICHDLVKELIRIPSSTAYLSCYDCYSYWVEGYKPEELVFKIIRHYRKQDL